MFIITDKIFNRGRVKQQLFNKTTFFSETTVHLEAWTLAVLSYGHQLDVL